MEKLSKLSRFLFNTMEIEDPDKIGTGNPIQFIEGQSAAKSINETFRDYNGSIPYGMMG